MQVKTGRIPIVWINALVLFVFFLPSLISLRAETDQTFKLDGISYEKENSSGSIAVINGEFLNTGDTLGSYQVTEIAPQAVRLKSVSSGETIELSLADEPKLRPAGSETSGGKEAPAAQKSEKKEEGKGFGFRKLFAGITNLWWEGAAVGDMRKIQTAAFRHLMSRDDPPTLKSLAKSRAIPENLSDGLNGKYRFRLKVSGLDFEIFADPVETDINLRYLYMDRLKTARYEYGKSAHSKSSLYRSEMAARSLLEGR